VLSHGDGPTIDAILMIVHHLIAVRAVQTELLLFECRVEYSTIPEATNYAV